MPATITKWPPWQWNRFPGYIPTSEFSVALRGLVFGPNVMVIAPGIGKQIAVTALSLHAFDTGGAAYAATLHVANVPGVPAPADDKWIVGLNFPAAIGYQGETVIFPPDEPILFGENRPVNVDVDTAIPAAVFIQAVVKGYLLTT